MTLDSTRGRAGLLVLVVVTTLLGTLTHAEPDTAERFGWPVSRFLYRYPPARRQLHDRITHAYLRRGVISDHPHLVLMAGGYGAGKSHALDVLGGRGILSPARFLIISADAIKEQMPEYAEYVRRDPATAATLVHRESGHIQIQVIEEALRLSKNIVVDGSLRARSYWRDEIERVRRMYPPYRISILSVTAPTERARERVDARATLTHRHIPEREIVDSAIEARMAVEDLRELVDWTFEFTNDRALELRSIRGRPGGCADDLEGK